MHRPHRRGVRLDSLDERRRRDVVHLDLSAFGADGDLAVAREEGAADSVPAFHRADAGEGLHVPDL